jgi:hypothetical protein
MRAPSKVEGARRGSPDAGWLARHRRAGASPRERGADAGALRGAAEPDDRGAAWGSERGACRLPADDRSGALRAGCSRADGDPLGRELADGRLDSGRLTCGRGSADGRAEDPADGWREGRAEGSADGRASAPDEPREEPADGLDGARGSVRSLGPAAEPRFGALGRSGCASVCGANRSEGRALPPPRFSVAGARTPALGVRALGRLGVASPWSLGTLALGRPAAGRSFAGDLPTAGDSRPLGRSVAGARVGEAVLGARGVVRAEPAAPPSLSDGRAEGLWAGRSAEPVRGLAARGVDALGPNRSIAGRPWGRVPTRAASPAREAAVAGEATVVAVGRRTAVRTTEPRGSSL